MGLFSSSTKTYVGTTISRVIEDKKFIPSTLSGTIKAIFAQPKPGSIPEYVMEDLINSIGLTHKRYYRYGRDSYLYGLPRGSGISENYGSNLVRPILQVNETEQVGMIYTFYGPFNYVHHAYFLMDQLLDYNSQTRELRVISNELQQSTVGLKSYLSYIELRLSQSTYDSLPLDTWKSRSGPVEITIDNAMGNRIKAIAHHYHDDSVDMGEGNYQTVRQYGQRTVSEDIRLAVYYPERIYYHSHYKAGTAYKYWSYHIGAGVYETLDESLNVPHQTGGTYMPWVYFRYAKVRGNENKASDWYKHSRKLLKKINMDYDKICDGIHENPDIADVEQAMMWWAVEADSQDPEDRKYLYKYFNQRFEEMGGMPYDLTHADLLQSNGTVASLMFDAAMVIQDARFKMALSHRGMYRRMYQGSIGPVGAYSSGELTLMVQYTDVQTNEGGDTAFISYYPMPAHYYRLQVNDGWYEEIMIFGMEMKYHIYGDYNTTGDGDDDDTRTDLLQIPVDIALLDGMSLLKREKFFSRTMNFIFNSRVTVKIKWYQQGWFTMFIFIVAFAIAVYTGQFAALDAFIAGTAGMTAVQIVTAIAVTGLQYIAVSVAFKMFVKVVGVKIAFLVAIVAMAAGVAVDMGTEIGANLQSMLPNATDLLKVGTNLTKAIQAEMQGDLLGMQEQMQVLQSEAARLDKELQQAADALYADNRLAPFINPAEMPEDFFNRTVHAGNIGMISIDAVGNYVERALSLPTLNDTLGDFS